MEIIKSFFKGLGSFLVSLLGILGWLLQSLLQLLTISLIACVVTALIIYTKVKPDLDHCREIAYDKLAQMDRQDFRMLSDTEVYDKDGQIIGLINAGHYEYVPINKISINIQNAYIAQEDRRFKSHTGVDWIATSRAALALIKNHGAITQGGSTITQQTPISLRKKALPAKSWKFCWRRKSKRNIPKRILWNFTATRIIMPIIAMASKLPAATTSEKTPPNWLLTKLPCLPASAIARPLMTQSKTHKTA